MTAPRASGVAVMLALLVAAPPVRSQSLMFFPPGRLMPRLSADALAHQLSLSRVTDNREWIGVIGVAPPLLQWGENVQAGAGASVFNRIIKTPGHITVATVDYRIDFPVDVRLDSLRLRIGYGHISSHYADDGIEQLGRRSISSVRDYLHLAGAWMLASGFLHGGATWRYHNEPVTGRPWELQAGGEFSFLQFGEGSSAYAAVDLKLKEDVGWGTTRSFQVGVRLLEGGRGSLRIAFTHRTGFEERGQVYDLQAVTNLLSLFLDVP